MRIFSMLSWLTFLAVAAAAVPVLAQDNVTLTTYYPSPRGVYQELRTLNNTHLAMQGGITTVGLDIAATPVIDATPRLHLHESTNGQNMLKFTNATTGIGAGAGFWVGINAAEQAVFNQREALDMLFMTSNSATPQLRIAAGGNIAIGNTEPVPLTPLAIRRQGATSDVGITQNQVGGGATMELTTRDGGAGQATRLLLRGGTHTADIEFYRGARGSEVQSMFISGTNGFVGIGTNAPAGVEQLRVDGSILMRSNNNFVIASPINNDPGDILFQNNLYQNLGHIWSVGTGGLRFSGSPVFSPPAADTVVINHDPSGARVGVKTLAPRRPLDVNGEIVAVNRITLAQNMDLVTGTWHLDNAAGRFRIFDQPNINTAGTERFTIETNGEGRLGRTNPDAHLRIGGTYFCNGADLAEHIPFAEAQRPAEPGDLLVIDPDADDQVKLSDRAFDTGVVGVVSDSAGVVMGVQGDNTVIVGLVGRIQVKVTAENGPIRRGDLLVASSKPGHAMRAERGEAIAGTIIGKAMGELAAGEGKIVVLVNLQ